MLLRLQESICSTQLYVVERSQSLRILIKDVGLKHSFTPSRKRKITFFISHKLKDKDNRKSDSSNHILKVGKQKEDCNHSFSRLNKAARLAVTRVKEVNEHVPRSLKRPKNCQHQFSMKAEGKDGTNQGRSAE